MRILILCALIALLSHGAIAFGGRHPPPAHFAECCAIPDLIGEEIKQKCSKPQPPELFPATEQKAETAAKEEIDQSENSTENTKKSHESDESDEIHPPPFPFPGHGRPHFPPCFLECALNETAILVDNKIDETKLHKYLSEVLKLPTDIATTLEQSFKTCSDKADEFKAHFEEHFKKHGHGGRHGRHGPGRRHHECKGKGFIVGCVYRETFNNCPASIWTESEKCQKLQELSKDWKPHHPHGRRHGSRGHHGRFHPQETTEQEDAKTDV